MYVGVFKYLMVRRFLMEGERELQTDQLENKKAGLTKFYAGTRWNKNKNVNHTNSWKATVSREQLYSEVSPVDTLNIITALLYSNCFVSERTWFSEIIRFAARR